MQSKSLPQQVLLLFYLVYRSSLRFRDSNSWLLARAQSYLNRLAMDLGRVGLVPECFLASAKLTSHQRSEGSYCSIDLQPNCHRKQNHCSALKSFLNSLLDSIQHFHPRRPDLAMYYLVGMYPTSLRSHLIVRLGLDSLTAYWLTAY